MKYDELGNIVESSEIVAGSTVNTIKYFYNSQLKLSQIKTTIIDQVDEIITEYEYDEKGNQISMIDKNSGEFHYAYNPFGELLWQTKKTTSTNNFREYFTYDQLGRIQKTELKDVSAIPTLIRETNYDYYLFGDGVSNVKQIKLNEYDSPSSYTTTQQIDYTYDRHGRMLKKIENIKGEEFNYQYSYNSKGQLSTETYPSYVKVKYEYTDKGYHNLLKRIDRNHEDELWELISTDQYGSTTEYSLADGKIVTEKGYDDYKFPTTTLTTGLGVGTIQNLNNTWDVSKGLLSSREDLKNQQREEFIYDDLFRLVQSKVENHRILPPVIKSDTMNYHIDGAMEYKSDIGAYRYKDVSGNLQNPVHGVKRIGNIYNKNITYQTNDLNTVYNSFRKIETIEGFVKPYYNCYNRAEFSYGYDESRTLVTFQSKATSNDPYIETHKKYYLSNYEYYVKANQDTKEVTYISTRNGVVAAIINETNQPERTVYVHKDYLGSVQSLSEVNSQGQVFIVAEFSFDAWGRARSHTDWDINFQSDASVPGFALLERGFTGHEHIIQFGIINMNARLYDPVIASFLSPDDVVSDPENPQNYNRFSYALNNPMRYTDPSGNNPLLLAMAYGALIGATTAAVTYSITAAVTDNWTWKGFGSAIGMGAIGGAIGGGFGYLGATSMLGSFGNSFGYNMISNIGSSAITSAIYGNDLTLGSISGMVIGSAIGGFAGNIGKYGQSATGNFFKDIGASTAKGTLTGFVKGIVRSGFENNPNAVLQETVGGAIGGFSSSLAINILYGNPVDLNVSEKVKSNEKLKGLFENRFNKPVFRSGGLLSGMLGGQVFGRDVFLNNPNTKDYEGTLAHELFHLYQQDRDGFATFYVETIWSHINQSFFGGINPYKQLGSYEWEAEQFELKF